MRALLAIALLAALVIGCGSRDVGSSPPPGGSQQPYPRGSSGY